VSSILNRLTQPAGLDWYVADTGNVVVTIPRLAVQCFETRIFRLGNIAADRRAQVALIGRIASTIEPESWSEVGGPGVIQPLGNLLIVRHNRPTLEQVERLVDGPGK
jgi:hypothetical protein